MPNCSSFFQDITVGMQGDGGHRVHVWLCNVFDHDGDVEFPSAHTLVVRSGDKASVVIDKGDGVDGTEMLVVLLGHLAAACVELLDLLVPDRRI